MRPLLALAAVATTGVAALVSALDGDRDEFAFFVLLAVAALGVTVGVASPSASVARAGSKVLAGLWAVAGLWIGGLLLMYQATCGCSMPVPPPEATYLGLTATSYHLVGMYLSNALVLVAALGRSPFLDRPIGPIGRIEHSG